MEGFLKILLIEDSLDDVQLIERELLKEGTKFTLSVVVNQREYEETLKTFHPDIVLSDHSLPQFNSVEALRILLEYNATNNLAVPFILVTGTVSEDFAVQCIKSGVTDFILKDRLKRLPSAIMNALQKSASDLDKVRYLRQVVANEALMRQAEGLAHFGSWSVDLLTGKFRWSDETFRIYGYEPGEVIPDYEMFLRHVHPDDIAEVKDIRGRIVNSAGNYDSEFRIIDRKGRMKHLASKIVVKRNESNTPVTLIGVNLDITERKKAELQLRRSQLEYKSLFDQNPDAVYSLDVDGNFTKVNRSLVLISGVEQHELIGINFVPFVAPEDLLRVQNHFQSALQGNPQRYQASIVNKLGRQFLVDITNIPIVVNNEVIGVHGIAKDITEKVRLQGWLDRVYQLARIGGWEVDLVHGTVKWTDITKELHEVDADFVPDMERGLSFYKDGEHRECIQRVVDDAIKYGKPFDVELQIVTAKGNLRWIRTIGEAEFIDNKCVRLYGSFQDIHEKKSADEAIKRAYLEKVTILESIGDAFFAVDRNWIVTYWNGVAAEKLQMPREEVIGKNLWDAYSDAKSLAFYREYHEAMESGKAVHFEEFYPTLNLWFDVSAYPSADGLSIYFRDITATRRQAKEMEAQNAKLTEIAWSLSHDLRAPVARLMGLMHLLRDYPEQHMDLTPTIRMMLQSADELDQVIRKITRKTEDLDLDKMK